MLAKERSQNNENSWEKTQYSMNTLYIMPTIIDKFFYITKKGRDIYRFRSIRSIRRKLHKDPIPYPPWIEFIAMKNYASSKMKI